ncbi:MAG TPA: sigma 54-interacting transcriptional regulator [Anaerovoracaceae bacterium]|nr:sigma 54-interacting transcriptional regulator [Anaerovoracaceae bacterium]
MKPFSEEYNNKLLEYWNRYIKDGEPMPENLEDVRPFIYESWKRSKVKNVFPLEVKDKKLSPDELRYTFKRNEVLMSVAHSYVENLYSYVKGSNFIIALTDNHGYVLDLVGQDPDIQLQAKRSGLAVGCNRNEEYSGTNGIGTCLVTGQPVQIWGNEHYIKPHHSYVCSAAPIRNQYGTIIGCLDIVGPVGAVTPHTLAMVCAAVDGIEKEIKMRETYEKISITNNQLVSTIQSISSGIVMIDNMGIITQHNNRAIQFLKLPNKKYENENLANILDLKYGLHKLLDLRHDFNNKEVSLVNHLGVTLHLSLSAKVIYNTQHEKINTVIIIEEQQRIHKMVSKMSGFTARFTFDSIIGTSEEMMHVIEVAKMAAQSDSNVLILGESGTGKELLAQSIHNASDRANGPFIAINCGSLPKGLIESELFGYESGAFTGASKDGQPGKFELASGGTIFLDEIGDMALELQATLLRVIQTREVVRIGGRQPKKIDVRIMSATNVNLLESVQSKSFRSDLYYRLNVLSILIPPLRKRKADIPVLIDHFIRVYNQSMGKRVSELTPESYNRVINYNWPGNVRELENTIERALNLTQDDIISEDELPQEILHKKQHETVQDNQPYKHPDAAGVRNKEAFRIISALEQEAGNITNASAILGIPKRTLYRKLGKYNIDVNDYR